MKFFSLTCVIMFASGGACFNIVSMKEWSGEDSRRTEVLPNPVSLVVIQHTVTGECLSDEECQKILNTVRNYFLNLQFDDMAHSFFIGGNGKVYEGGGWKLVGAHTRGYNRKSIGIGFIGDFREKSPTPEALKAAQDLLSYGVSNQHLSKDYKLVGHRQLSNTISPGEALQNIIQTWPHWADLEANSN